MRNAKSERSGNGPLERNNFMSLHLKNLQLLLVDIFKTKENLNSCFISFHIFWEGGPSAWLIFEGPSLKLQWNTIKLNTYINYRNKS